MLAPFQVLLGVYGLYQALTEGVTKAMIADVVPKDQRAGAMGLLYTVTGLGQLVASMVDRALWPVRLFHGSMMVSFVVGAICAAAAVPLVASVPGRDPDEKSFVKPPADAIVIVTISAALP